MSDVRYWVRVGDDQRGPVTAEQLVRGYESGKLPADALVAADGDQTWQALQEALSGLKHERSAAGLGAETVPSPVGDGWYLARGGESGGPYHEQQVIAWITDGMRDALVRKTEREEWRPLATHLPFAEALQRAGSALSRGAPDVLGWLLVVLPAVTGLGLLFVPSLGLLLGGGMVIGTVVVAAMERHRFPNASSDVILMLLLWIAGYPIYLNHRGKLGGSKLLLPGLLSMGCFFGAIVLGSGLFASIQARCTASGLGTVTCSFDNSGIVPGRSCVRVVLTRRSDQSSIRSAPVCSDTIMPGSSQEKTRDAAFSTSPFAHCTEGTELGTASWTDLCAIDVVASK